jgi:hypothetical protein
MDGDSVMEEAFALEPVPDSALSVVSQIEESAIV